MDSESHDPRPKNDDLELENNDKADEGEASTMTSVSSWLSSWYDSAKKKVVETNEFMKRDLQEFSQAVQSDASKLVAATATTMKEKLHINVDMEEASSTTRSVTDSLSNFLGNIANKVGPIRPSDDENSDVSAIVGTPSGTRVLSPSEARIYAIQTDPATFCNEPDSEEEYFMWLPSFNAEDRKSEISTLMLDCSQIRSLYTKLVPAAVSHSDFWARYYFKLHQHNKAEERRAMLMERAHKTHNDIEWDDEDDDLVHNKHVQELTSTENSRTELPLPDPPQESPGPTTVTEQIASGAANSRDISSIDNETEIKQSSNGDSDTKASNSKNAPESSETKSQEEKTSHSEAELKTSSTFGSSDDWEKDFDLDMTEDEIQAALKESNAVGVNTDDIGDDWDEWE